MNIIAKAAAHYAANLGRVYASLPPKSTETPINAEALRPMLKEKTCPPTIH